MASHKSCHARQSSPPDNKTLYNVMMVSTCLSSLMLLGCKLALVYHQHSDNKIIA